MWLKPSVFIAALFPAAYLIFQFATDQLGPEPYTALTQQSGEWTLRFLLLTLGMTPLRYLLKQSWPIKIRRMVGLFVFFYACLHLTTYLWFDQFFDWHEIWVDIKKRPFITLGMLAWLLLLPLVFTSTRAMQKRLGYYWVKLHKLVYLIAGLGIAHFYLLVKADYWWPSVYLLVFLLLMSIRLRKYFSKRARPTT